MASTITCSPVASRTVGLVRRVGGVELPAAGPWNVPGSHADIYFSLPRRLRRPQSWPGRVAEAMLGVGEDPDDVIVTVLVETGLSTVTRGSSGAAGPGGCLVARADSSPLPWVMSGEVRTSGLVLPLRATLDYHGVWRRGDSEYGWFTLGGAFTTRPTGGRHSVHFSIDVVADVPRAETRVA